MSFGGGSGQSTLSSASDVFINTLADGQQLQYNSGIAKWQNGAASTKLIEAINTVASSGSALTLPDVTTATIHNITLTANCTFTFPAATSGKSFIVRIAYSSSGLNITWPASVVWPNGVAPTLTSTVAKRDVFSFACISSGEWMGFTAGLNY